MDPQGRFLFVADTGSKQIVVFKIDQTTGALSQQGAPVSGGDTGLIVDPSGNFLYAANVAAAGIYGFRIDQTTGSLTPIPGSPFRAGNEPLYFAIAAPHPTSTLAVNFFTPTHGGNTGQVTMQLYGSGFRNGATVKLTGSGPDIVGANTTLSNPSEIVTTFNLLGVNPGLRTLSISLPDATSVEITNGFMIESRGASELSLVIVGRDKIRIGTPQTFYVALQNTGIVDSGPTRVFVSLPDYLQVAQRGTADLIPAGIYSATPIQEEASHPLALLSRFATGNQTASFITGRVPAGTTQYAPIQITYPFNVATSDFTVTANQLRDLENYPTNFSDYAAQHGAQFPFVHLAGVPDRCVPLEDAAIKAYSSAESKYTALKSSQDNANQQLLLIVGSSALATMQAEVLEGIGVTELGKVALGAFVTEVRGCIYRNIEDPLNQACLPNVDELMTEVKTGAVELLASQFSEKLSEFVSYTTSAIVGLKPENVDEYNRLIAVRGSALTDFQNAFKAYMQALSKYSSCSGYTPPPPYNPFGISSLLVSPVGALDPNAKTGPSGIGASRFVAGSVPLTYNLEFGNESRATAPAQTVLITDPLPSTLAANTFTFGPITIGSHVSIPPPSSASSFGTVLDLRPDNDLLVQIDAQLDHAGRKASWKFTSIDPTTGQPPTDPTVGFLPPGASGSTSFRVNVSANTNTRVDNHAQIVFDVNPPISTAVWSNAIDALPPHSRVLPLPPNQQASCFSLQWIGSDIGAGLRSVTILASDNGGPYTAWLSNTASAAVLFTGQPGHTYSFFSQATDLVGNVEPAKNSAEATTTVEPGASCNGRPSIAGSVTSKSRNGVTERLTLQFRNTGIGNARNVSLNGIVFRTLAGTGSVTLSGPRLPISLGGPAAGASTAVTLTLTVPATVREFSINEIGTVSDEANNHYQFSIGQTVFP
jgi:hypothetical protein